jgi:hypothetical protein
MVRYLGLRLPDRHASLGVVWLVGVVGLIALLGCKGYDSDFIPYDLIGFDVYVYHEPTDQEFFVRRVESSWTRRAGILDCNAVAVDEANRRSWPPGDWSYICCTVTRSSSCVTKVR